MTYPEETVLVLEAAGQLFGFSVERVESVIAYAEPPPMPRLPRQFLGGMLHQGEFVGIVHLASQLGLESRLDPEKSVVAVVTFNGGLLGIAAEASHGLFRPGVSADEVAVMGRWEGRYCPKTVRWRDRDVHLIDLDAFNANLARRVESA